MAPDRLRGKSVLLALPGQLDAVRAIVALDGVAGRIFLCPLDKRITDLDAMMRHCGAEEAVTDWPPPGEAASGTTRGAGPIATEWVLFTSGSTGTPKLVSHRLQSLAGHLLGRPAPASSKPVWCTFYDIRRYGGLQILLRALLGGGSLVLSAAGETPADFLARAARDGATHFLGTPSHWRRALLTPAHKLISPVYVRLSGEVANQAILDQLKSAYPQALVVHAFASTEAGLGFEVSDGLAGFPASLLQSKQAGVELRVCDGTLRIRSSRTAAGLLDRPDTPLADAEGFVDTGDEVVLHGDRYVFAGRRDGIINVGGQKVHPEEVEAVINQHPHVHMSRVAARRNPLTGAIVVAEIVLREAASSADEALGARLQGDIKAFCRDRLDAHKVPVFVTLVPSLPIAPSGKLVRLHA